MINRFFHVTFRQACLSLYTRWLRRRYGMNIDPSVRISLKAKLDKTNPRGVHIGEGSYVAFGAVVLTHDMSRNLHADVHIGKNCFIGGNSMILPGVRIGDQCIVAAGAIVTKSVPSHCIVAGNPAKVVKSGIVTDRLGILTISKAA